MEKTKSKIINQTNAYFTPENLNPAFNCDRYAFQDSVTCYKLGKKFYMFKQSEVDEVLKCFDNSHLATVKESKDGIFIITPPTK